MTPEKLLLLIKSWQANECPGEILFDALLDYGYDPDESHQIKTYYTGTIRVHLLGDEYTTDCSSSPYYRMECGVVRRIRQEIEAEIASKNAPFTGENTPATET